MAPQPEQIIQDGGWNYFNYYTEVEEHFQRARGTGLFLLSPLDWALIETWKDAGIPLEAVLRGIDVAFEKWRARRTKRRAVNSLTYCAQAVYHEAQRFAAGGQRRETVAAAPPFELEELRTYLARNAAELRKREGFADVAASLERLAAEADRHFGDLEALEQRLSALEDKMSAVVKAGQSEESLFEGRRELENTLRPYRSKMTADQLAMLERQYFERWLLDKAGLPRLSLFYLR